MRPYRQTFTILAACCLLLSTLQAAESDRTTRQPFSPERFVRAFQSNRENVQRKLLAEVMRVHLGHPEVPLALGQAIDHARQIRRITRTVLLAVYILGECDGPEVVPKLIEFLSDPDLRLVMTAMDVLAAKAPAEALPAIIALADRSEFQRFYGFRHALVCAVGRFQQSESVDFLTELLPRTTGQLKYETARQLTDLTAQNFGAHADDWQQWWERSRDEVEFPVLAAQKQQNQNAAMPWDEELPDFFSIEIYARRLVFVIDMSKSMLSSVNGETRLERIQTELRKAIQELPEYAEFDVVAFNQGMRRCRGKLVPASEENKQQAYAFILALTAERKTACYDALRNSLADYQEAEAIIFLTDGHPTAGTVVDPSQIVERISETNRFLRISINSVGVDSRQDELEFLKQLARRNHGKYGLMR